jgi:YfiH family protein
VPTAISLESSVCAGRWSWQTAVGSARCVFFGKAVDGGEDDVEGELARRGLEVARLRQIHSARVVDAHPGDCGDGDALLGSRPGLALRVITADCVPVLLESAAAIAAVHAGWRGLAAGIVGAAASRLGERPRAAVVGPAIGGCCYEVGPEVAAAVAAEVGSDAVILDRGEGRRPHLDLPLAARLLLERAGVDDIATVGVCTRCEPTRLWSYRRDGRGAGRNYAFLWRERSTPGA